MRRVTFLSVIALLFLSLLTVADLSVFAQEKDKVTLRMSWFPYADYAVYVVGLEKGFYKEEGIDLKIEATKGSGLTTKLIGNREAEFASASGETTLIARTKGMPLKVLATLHQTSPVSIVSLKEKGIAEPKDLEGKSLASDPNSMKHKQFQALCEKNGVDIEKIEILPIKGSDFVHILKGRADCMLAFGYIADALLKRKGHDINEIKLADYGIDVYSMSLITNEDLIEERPGLVKKFVRAAMKSWEYAVSHPNETVQAYVDKYPELKKEDQYYQVLEVISLMQNDYTREHGLGYQSRQKWQKTRDLLYEQGLLGKKIDVNQVYTNEFLPY